MDNILININDIRNRITNLSESAYHKRNNCNVNIKTCYDNLMNSNRINKQLANICMENWMSLNENNTKSFEMIIDAYDHICLSEDATPTLISHYCNLLCEKAIPKVRDGKQAQSYINRKIGRFKTKLFTNINNNIEKTKNAAASSIQYAKNNFDNNINKMKNNVNNGLGMDKNKEDDEKENVTAESFQKLYNAATVIVNCDRLLENYNKVSKRFNIDRLLFESLDVQDFIIEYCRLIDTYTISNTNKFIIATETAMYTLDKNHSKYNKSSILKYACDYFTAKEDASISDIKDGLESTLFYDPKRGDMEDVEYITEYDPSKDELNGIDESLSSYNTYNIDYIIEANSNPRETAKDIFNKFKLLPNKTAEGLKSVIKRIYSKSDTMIIDEVPNILSYIRTVFIAGSIAINPILGVVAFIADQAISLHIKRTETKKMLDKYEKEKEKVEKKIAKLKDDGETKKRYTEYLNTLNKSIDKLDLYYKDLLTEKENDKREAEKYEKEIEKDTDFDFDFNLDDDEWKVETVLSNIINKMEFISENSLNSIINKIDKDKIKSIRYDDIDLISEFVLNYGNNNEKYNLLSILEDSKEQSRCENRYILTDCLNQNIYIMNKYNEEKTIDSFDKLNLYYECINNINDIVNANPVVFNEVSFTNSLILAGEKLKKSMVNMSDAEKNASKNIDITMNNLRKAAERAVANDNREAIIKGSILPSTSKMLKIALTSGIAALFNPVIAAIGLLGYIGCSAKMKSKERQMILDEIEIELKMVDRYLKQAEDNNDLKAQRELLKTQRNLERQHQRIKYKMKVEFNQNVPNIKNEDDD